MDAGTAIRQARRLAGLSKRELARRGHTSAAAIVMYESGTREPTVPTLQRILVAAGVHAEIHLHHARVHIDPAAQGARLAQVLDLADRLPKRRASRHLEYPLLPQ